MNFTVDRLTARIPNVFICGDEKKRLPGMLNAVFEGMNGESLMHFLDLRGICVSTGSACHSGNEAPSHVLTALGLSEEQAKSAIRISYGRYNTMEEVETIVEAVSDAYEKIRERKQL